MSRFDHLQDGRTSIQCRNTDRELSGLKYIVFPGVELIYNEKHFQCSTVRRCEGLSNTVMLDYCFDGEFECCVGKEQFHLSSGDLALSYLDGEPREERYQTNQYRGITIRVNLEECPKSLDCILPDVDVAPEDLVRKFCLDKQVSFVLRQMPAISYIFSGFFDLSNSMKKKGFFKVKFLELVLFLNTIDPEQGFAEQHRFSEVQERLAKEVHSYLMERVEQHITIAQLAEHFGVSAAQIKNSFTRIYGMSPHAYMRGQRMRMAAKMLRQTNRNIQDIAGQFGYDNGSKFANAFRAVMGVTPTQYRKNRYNLE